MSDHAFLKNSLIVAAHADDEVLWFNAIAKDVDQIIVVFEDFWAQPGIGAARRAALAEYPRKNVSSLAIPESGAYGCAQWDAPQVSDAGLEFGLEAGRRAVTRFARKSLSRIAPLEKVASESVANSYRANHRAIREALRDRLSPGMNVFTHNP